MPLYLIRETNSPLTTIASPVMVYDIEVEADSLRAAAEAVMDRPKGRLPNGMRFRANTHEPYTNMSVYIPPDPSHYAGIADIAAGNRATLPPPIFSPREESMEAARAVLAATSKALRIDDEGKPEIAVYHLLHALIDHAHSIDANFGETLSEVIADRPDITGGKAPVVRSTAIGTDPSDAIAGSAAAGKAALDLSASMDPMEGGEEHGIALYHLLHSVLDLCEVEGIDFGKIVDEVRDDRPEATAGANPR